MKLKHLLATLALGMLPVLALSTNAAAADKASAKPAANGKATNGKATSAKADKNKLAPSAQKAVEEVTPLEEADPNVHLSDADLEVARKVHVGDFPCELGARVKIIQLKKEGFFLIATGKYKFRMHPVESRTGAVRLEDPHRGAMWLQLGNKSMLMSAKLGQRLADECQSPDQATFAEAMKGKPAVNLLEPPPAAAPAATAIPVVAPAVVATPIAPAAAPVAPVEPAPVATPAAPSTAPGVAAEPPKPAAQ